MVCDWNRTKYIGKNYFKSSNDTKTKHLELNHRLNTLRKKNGYSRHTLIMHQQDYQLNYENNRQIHLIKKKDKHALHRLRAINLKYFMKKKKKNGKYPMKSLVTNLSKLFVVNLLDTSV